MLIEITAAIVYAKIKRFKLKYLFKAWSFYPILTAECALFFLQITAFAGNYYFVRYTEAIRIFHTFSYLFAMITFSLYKPALIGSGSMIIGTLLNKFVIAQNGGKMPVYPTLSYWTGYVKADTFKLINDIHVLGGINTKWKFLTDYIDVGYCIMSPGDVFIHIFTILMFYHLIKAVNRKYNPDADSTKIT